MNPAIEDSTQPSTASPPVHFRAGCQEAMGAKKSLESTHFYGRHLVGEWAEDGEDMDALRAKAARDLRGPSNGGRPAKRQKAASSGDDFADMDG